MPVRSMQKEEDTEKRSPLVRNYILNISDGSFFNLAMGMVPLNTVLTYFISDFVSQKWLIGLLSFLNILLMFSPQILVSKKLEKLRLYKPFLLKNALALRLMWLLLGLDVLLFARSNPVLFVVLFYLFYSLIGLFSAFTNITWLNFIVKIIPNEYRGRFMGIRSTISGVFESMGALLMGVVIHKFSYPVNYGVLFLIVFSLTMISIWIVSLSVEEESEKGLNADNRENYWNRMVGVIKSDTNFSWYLITVALIGGFGKMAFAFHILFAKEKLGIIGQQVAYATFILLISQSVGYLLWGLIGDKYGFKITLELSAVIFLPALLLTYLMSDILVFYISMGLFGLAQSARNVNENNLALNLCQESENQPLYIGLRNFLMGPLFALNPVFAGLIFDFLGLDFLFASSTIFILAGLIIMLRRVREYK